jgi:hypothetical protein
MQLFICNKSHCLHLHHHKCTHAPSILLRFILLTSCRGPPPPSAWTQPPICGDIGGRWRHEGILKIEDAWSIGCLLKSSLNRLNTIGVGVEGKGNLRTWGYVCVDGALRPRGQVVPTRTQGFVRVDRRCLGRWVVSAQTELCVYTENLLRRLFIHANFYHGRYSSSKSQTPEGPLSSFIRLHNNPVCTYMELSLNVHHDIFEVQVSKLAVEATVKAIKEWGAQPQAQR